MAAHITYVTKQALIRKFGRRIRSGESLSVFGGRSRRSAICSTRAALWNGRMPLTSVWDRPWHETPNIHPCTIRDFCLLCEAEWYVVEKWLAVDDAGPRSPGAGSPDWRTCLANRRCSGCARHNRSNAK
jgi:hypothetical protein